jgi:hypothetical protein
MAYQSKPQSLTDPMSKLRTSVHAAPATPVAPVKLPVSGDVLHTPPPTGGVVNEAARTMGRESYGANAWAGRSSLNPGEKMNMGRISEEMARRYGSDDIAGMRNGLQPGGLPQVSGNVHLDRAPQTRSISDDSYPATPGIARVTPRLGERVPGKIGGTK